MSSAYTVPLFLRGEVITDDLVSFGTRSGGAEFQAPDMSNYVARLPLANPMAMSKAAVPALKRKNFTPASLPTHASTRVTPTPRWVRNKKRIEDRDI